MGASVNRSGLVSVQIRQAADGRIFDIDAMSSGEKGLILTFLLIGRSVANGGIVLIVDWQTLCDRKRFFRDLHAKFEVQVSHLKFKKMIAERMEREQSAGWVLVEKLVSEALRIS